jgi:hypothetical protein
MLAAVLLAGCDGADDPGVPPDTALGAAIDAAAADAAAEAMCPRMCAAKLRVDCPKETFDTCVDSCLVGYTGPCGAEFIALDGCLLGHPDPWFCLAGLGITIRSNACVDEQAALILCPVRLRSDAGASGN